MINKNNTQERDRKGFINAAIYEDGMSPKEVNEILEDNKI